MGQERLRLDTYVLEPLTHRTLEYENANLCDIGIKCWLCKENLEKQTYLRLTCLRGLRTGGPNEIGREDAMSLGVKFLQSK